MPGEVGRRVLEGVFRHQVSPQQVSCPLTTGVHWAYGTSLGVLASWHGCYTARSAAVAGPPSMLAMDLGFHLIYGFTATAVFRALR